ncbi:MAG: CYTH domain-containing protein [Pirellulaceae bacterium]|nr:CYTH domain-containing protein [Pirellulaceae bacterium]
MGVEIERKFLVSGTDWKQGPGRQLSQGYLNQAGRVTVRVRVDEARGFLTIKGPTEGIRRAEFEYEIPVTDARELLQLCQPPLIEKRRYEVVSEGQLWEIDEFLGENSGLVVAEIELPSEDTPFSRPVWLGAEVSTDPRYRNSNLAILPFSRW